MSDERRSEEPHDRLTMIAAAMLRLLEDDELIGAGVVSGNERAIVLLHDTETDEGATAFHAFDDDRDVAMMLFQHMRAIFRVHGQDAVIAPLGGDE